MIRALNFSQPPTSSVPTFVRSFVVCLLCPTSPRLNTMVAIRPSVRQWLFSTCCPYSWVFLRIAFGLFAASPDSLYHLGAARVACRGVTRVHRRDRSLTRAQSMPRMQIISSRAVRPCSNTLRGVRTGREREPNHVLPGVCPQALTPLPHRWPMVWSSVLLLWLAQRASRQLPGELPRVCTSLPIMVDCESSSS